MKIKEVKLRSFKRFTETTIKELPETAKLVIIAGPNGCGKSSFFEALNVWSRAHTQRPMSWDHTYHLKLEQATEILNWNHAVKIEFYGENSKFLKKSIYIRSAYRNDPEFQLQTLNRLGPAVDEHRLNRMIDNDATVSSNYQRLASQAMQDAFETEDETTTIGEFREKTIGEIKEATTRLFPDLVMNSLGNPLKDGTFNFDKGNAKSFSYKNLSGGEKAAFDLLLDIIVKRREFDDTIFCVDEPEAHMNSRLQGRLLEELYTAIGENCQLWLATHSAGMMRMARDLERTSPGTVVFLDFGGRNYDEVQVVTPETPTRAFWGRVLDVAFDDFADLMAPRQLIICEGSCIGAGGPSEGLDAKIYDRIFSREFPDARFIPGGNCKQVESDRLALIESMKSIVRGTDVWRLIDRDDLSSAEVEDRKANGISVLTLRNFECYLFHDDALTRLYINSGRKDLIEEILNFKAEELKSAANNRSRPEDDVKSVAGPVMNKIKQHLRLYQQGSTVKEFCLNVLASNITLGSGVYERLKSDIFEGREI